MSEPDVSPPAVMRNYHEVLRNDLQRVLAPLAQAAELRAFTQAWHAYRRAIAVHAAMEDGVSGAGGGSVAMLDHHFNGAAGATLFAAEHVQEHAAQDAVTEALRFGPGAWREAFAHYCEVALAHLLHEEDILMPLVARLPSPKAPLFAHWCVSAGVAQGDFDHWVAHGVGSLARFGTAKNSPTGATRVFVHALKSVCTSAQWARYLPLARAAAAGEVWAAVLAEVPSLELAPALAG